MSSGSSDSRRHDGEVADDGVGWVNVDFQLFGSGDFADGVHGGFVAAVHREQFDVVVEDAAEVAGVNVDAERVLLQVNLRQVFLFE